jgi:hypothetical protein
VKSAHFSPGLSGRLEYIDRISPTAVNHALAGVPFNLSGYSSDSIIGSGDKDKLGVIGDSLVAIKYLAATGRLGQFLS